MKNPGKWLTRFKKEKTKVFQRLHGMALGILTSASIGEPTTPFPTLERASAVPRCSPMTPLELPFDGFTSPKNHFTELVFLLCVSSLLYCTPAIGRLMSESHVATMAGLSDCIWERTSSERTVSGSSKSPVSFFQSQSPGFELQSRRGKAHRKILAFRMLNQTSFLTFQSGSG